MASNNSGSTKRRRTAADTLHISDLPTGFIADVSTYLSKPSRAILAVAFTSSSLWQNADFKHQSSPISTAIISASKWDILDFEDINKELAIKLTDDHLDAILKCINARDVLKRLKLCGCVNITGHGLNPLRGSTVLEQIDISLVGKHDGPQINPGPKISTEVVVPILDSIISANGCSLKHLVLPHIWRVNESLEPFRERYNDMITRRNSNLLNCSHCNATIRHHGIWLGERNKHKCVCYACLKPFCEECTDETGAWNGILNYCDYSCEKDFCQDCVPGIQCADRSCEFIMCSGCKGTCNVCKQHKCWDCMSYCENCNTTRCADCVPYHGFCQGVSCHKSHCADCYDGKEFDVKPCDECIDIFCLGCKFEQVQKDGMNACRGCAAAITPLVVVDEMCKLRKENEDMAAIRKENDELREKLKHISS